jgi:uncharacterized protein (DUF3820 family)
MPEKYDDSTVLTFGVHKGKKLANVPAGWLIWYSETPGNYKNPQLMAYIEDNKMSLMQEADLANLKKR